MHQAQAVPQTPSPSSTELVVKGSLEGWELALILLITFGGIIAIAWPFLRSMAQRLERPLEQEMLKRLDQFEGELDQARTLETRVAELEERLDFAERRLQRPEEVQLSDAPPTHRTRES